VNNSFDYSIESAPDYALLNVDIPADNTLKVEASSMVSMDSNISMKTKMKGGISRLFTKESIFINEFKSVGGEGQIKIAPGPSGDIKHYTISDNKKFYLTASSFLAATPRINLNSKWQGFTKGFFSGESFFLMECSGDGQLWFNCYGAMFEIDIQDEYIVDTGHVVAFEEGLEYEISRIGGYKSLFFSGEGFVARFRGQGKVWIQTKNPIALVSWADRFRIIQRQENNQS